MERQFKRDIDELNDVFEFIDGLAETDEAMSSVSFPVRVAVEELFVNMVSHNPNSTGDIVLGFAIGDGAVTTILEDHDSEPFDITQLDDVDVSLPLEQRKVGGLGIHLVKKMMDEVYYEYEDRRTRIRLVKYFRKS